MAIVAWLEKLAHSKVEGSQAKSGDPRWGVQNFRRFPKGGAKNFGLPPKGGGRKILDLINFFSMFLKHNFSCFGGILGTFFIFWSKGGRKILDASRRGEAKSFRRLIISDSLVVK